MYVCATSLALNLYEFLYEFSAIVYYCIFEK